ncbi:TonB-dependent siderophore receptor [Acetobacter sp.]|uniref:TonB-dependent siderophore receptor n=1 Tax=Acetobacter sp. TaxID=440 RepID=UPI0039EBC8EC
MRQSFVSGLQVSTLFIMCGAFSVPVRASEARRADQNASVPQYKGQQLPQKHSTSRESNPSSSERQLDESIEVKGQSRKFNADVVQIGTFRNQSIMDTPMTVTVLTRALLDAQGAQTVTDAMRNVAGVVSSSTSPITTPNFMARGVQIQARTNYRLNGTLPIIALSPIMLENKERVEVLKGVSALYYGFTTPSAIANFVTKRATPQPVTVVSLTGDSVGSYGGGIDIGREFGARKQFGARANGYASNMGTTVNGISGNRWLVSGAFDWRPTDKLSLKLDIENSKEETYEPGGITIPTAVNGRITLPRIPSLHNRYAARDAPYNAWATNVLGRVDYSIWKDWAFRVEGGIARTRRQRSISNVSNVNVVTGWGTNTTTYTGDQNYYNLNVRTELSGSVKTGPIRHELLFGYNRNAQIQDDQNRTNYKSFRQNIYNPVDIDFNALSVSGSSYTYGSTNTDTGYYMMDRASFAKYFTLIGGARYENYTTYINQNKNTYTVKKVTPIGGLVIRPTKQSSLYGSYIQGLESAGTAPDSAANAGTVLAPVVSSQYEFGGRYKLKNALISVAYFHIDRGLSYANPDNVYVVNGRAIHKGVEISMQGSITHELSVSVSGTWTHAVQAQTGNVAQNGKSVIGVPDYALSAFGEYRPDFIPNLGLNAGVYYVGKRSADSLQRASVSDYVTLSLGGNYRLHLVSGQTITFRANGNNVTNTRYWSNADTVLFVGSGATANFSTSFSF